MTTNPISSHNLTNSMELTATRLINGEFDFQGSYMAVKSLESGIIISPNSISEQIVQALASVIESEKFESEKQAFFLYKEACDVLVKILTHVNRDKSSESSETHGNYPVKSRSFNNSEAIISIMEKVLSESINDRHRAVAEALGSLPLNISGPSLDIKPAFGKTSFQKLISKLGLKDYSEMHWQGRSIIGKKNSGLICVIKFVRENENPSDIVIEPWWMNFLNTNYKIYNTKFDIPKPIEINGNYLLKIKDIPEDLITPPNLHIPYFAIAYTITEEYFLYPNGNSFQYKKIDKQVLKHIFKFNAWLLGRLTAKGIIHTALIPLFHNRVQSDRRQDRGIYNWEQGGRLDQWLESCKYPNFAVSGLRDFEHFISIDTSKKIHHYIGSHLLSLILVLGSCFRNINPKAKGWDESGNPIDTRNLFDRELFHEIITIIIKEYYRGFTGQNIGKFFPLPENAMVEKLIDKMGVDDNMEEILRVDDQNRMDMKEFKEFLITRGMTNDEIKKFEKGNQDITILTGPHLGGFSQRISIPELIDFIFSCSAMCVSGKYIIENRLK